MEGEWSCYRGGQFNGEWSCYRDCQFGVANGGRMVMLRTASLMEGEWSCYREGQFNGRSMVMLRRWPV